MRLMCAKLLIGMQKCPLAQVSFSIPLEKVRKPLG